MERFFPHRSIASRSRAKQGAAKLVRLALLTIAALCGWQGCETELPTSGQDIWGRNEGEFLVIPVGSTISEIVADPRRPYLYAADFDKHQLYFISSNTRQIVKRLSVGSRPSDLNISMDGDQLYVALSGGSEIAVVDLERQEKVDSIPLSFSPAYLAAGRSPYFYVTSILEFWKGFNNYGQTQQVNAGTGAETPFKEIGLLEADGARSRLYVATYRQILQYDIEFGGARLISQVEAEGPILEIQLSDDGSRIFSLSAGFFTTPELVISHSLLNSQANLEIDYVEVFDTERMIKVGELYTGAFPRAVACSADYVAVAASASLQSSRLSSFVSVYDAQTLEAVATYRLLGTPTHCAALDANTNRLYVAVNNPYDLRERFGERQDLQVIALPPRARPGGGPVVLPPASGGSELPPADGGGEEVVDDTVPDDGVVEGPRDGSPDGGSVIDTEEITPGTGRIIADAPSGVTDIDGGSGKRIVWTGTGGVQHEMVLVPEGVFPMGSEEGDQNAQPRHMVRLDAYYMDVYEVTVAQYRFCYEAGVCEEPVVASLCNWYEEVEETHPMNCMYWGYAKTYCEWAGLRLPTEAEWEKAARGGDDNRTYPWGEDLDRDKANYGGGVMRTQEVGLYPEGVSPYGIYDMAGNVWEWCEDFYHSQYYSVSSGVNPTGPDGGTFHVLRGGSWHFIPRALRVFHREPYHPKDTDPDIGFRCARDAEQ